MVTEEKPIPEGDVSHSLCRSVFQQKAALFVSNNINESIKAVLFFKPKKWEQKVLGPNKLGKVRMYVWTFTNLLELSDYANLLVPQK